MKKDLIQTIKIITLSLLFSASFAFAWTAPTTLPPLPAPGDQTSDFAVTPINKSAVSQLKLGSLGVTSLGVNGTTGSSNFYGSVSILGSLSPSCPTGWAWSTMINACIQSIQSGGGTQQGFLIKSFNNIFSSLFKVNVAYALLNNPSVPTTCQDITAINYGQPLPCTYTPLPAPLPVLSFVNQSDNTVLDFGEISISNPTFVVNSDISGAVTFHNSSSFSGPAGQMFYTLDSCSSTPTSVTANVNTTITLNHFYNGQHSCSFSIVSSLYGNPHTNYIYVYFTIINNPAPVIPSNNLYMQGGKIGVGVSPTEALDVAGDLTVDSFTPNTYSVGSNRLCADIAGKMVLCTRGHKEYSSSVDVVKTFTVPDGVFRLYVCLTFTGCSPKIVYALPGQGIPIIFDTGSSSGISQVAFGTYFSTSFPTGSTGYVSINY